MFHKPFIIPNVKKFVNDDMKSWFKRGRPQKRFNIYQHPFKTSICFGLLYIKEEYFTPQTPLKVVIL